MVARVLRRTAVGIGLGLLSGLCGCGDPADQFIRQMDQAPPEQRPPNWAEVKGLMVRPAPRVGDPAPDFTLPTADGQSEITLSEYAAGRPTVLVFGSFT